MSLILSDKQPLDLGQLNDEVAVLRLAGFVGCARLSRDDQGNRVSPYILVKVGGLTSVEEQQVIDVVNAHVPIVPVPTRRDDLRDKLGDDTMTFDETKELLRLEWNL